MTYLLYVAVFVALACVVVPAAAFIACAAGAWRHKGRRPCEETRLSFRPTDGVR